MKRSLLLVLTIIYVQPILLSAQQDIQLPGLVVEQNSKYKTGQVNFLSGVSIKSPGAIPLVSSSDGRFTLVYSDQPFGGRARIYAAKSGYEVVNKKELESSAVIGRKELMKVVMSDPEEMYRSQVTYYGIAEDVIRKTYERQLKVIKGEGKEKDKLIAQLQQEMNRKIQTSEEAEDVLKQQLKGLEERVQGLADKFVMVNLDDQSETYIRAYEAFKASDLDLTIAILDSVDLVGRLATNEAAKIKEEKLEHELQAKIALRRQEMRQDIEQVVLKARSQRLKFQFDEAGISYELALQYDTLDMNLRWEYADMLAGLNQFDKAVHYYEQLLPHIQDDQQRAEVLTREGIILKGGMRVNQAEIRLKEALKIQRSLAEKDPSNALPALAGILNNLGVLYLKKGTLSYAEIYFTESLKIRQNLVQNDPNLYLAELAHTLNNLGLVYENRRQLDKADQQYSEALRIYKQLGKEEKTTYLPYVAATLNNKGNCTGNRMDIDKMKESYGEALNIYRELSKQNSKAYNLDLNSTAYNISLFYKQKLEEKYEEALKNEGLAYLQEAMQALSIYPDSVPVVQSHLEDLKDLNLFYQTVTPESVEKNNKQKKVKLLENTLGIESKDERTNGTENGNANFAIQGPPQKRIKKHSFAANSAGYDEPDKAFEALQRIPETKQLIELYLIDLKNDGEVKYKLSVAYNKLATDYLYTMKFKDAEQSAIQSLIYNPAATWINSNLALSLLYQGKWEKAKALLLQYKKTVYPDKQKFRTIFLEELDALNDAHIVHADVERARKLLDD